jgi:hypothetical protein
MTNLSVETLYIVAAWKIILVAGLTLMGWGIYKKYSPVFFSVVAAVMLAAAGWWLLAPAQKMWWGNNGDELFIGAAFTRFLQGSFGQDFYYSWLPPFYPPFYFWLFSLVGKLFVWPTLLTVKVGLVATLSAWFLIPALARFDGLRLAEIRDEILDSGWFWFAAPLLYLCLLDFDNILVKPYETLPALLGVIYLGLFALVLPKARWRFPEYSWFIVVGAILFMTFYFWWFIIGPALVLTAWFSERRREALARVVISQVGVAILSPLFLGPLFWSLWENGVESWQAYYFVTSDLNTFAPWAVLSLAAPLWLSGWWSIIKFFDRPFVKSLGFALGVAYFYQFVNIVIFWAGGAPVQAAKPFLFLTTAILATAAAYGLINLYNNVSSKLNAWSPLKIYILAVVFILPLTPFVRFIDKAAIAEQIEFDNNEAAAQTLAERINREVPGHQNIVWLTSGAPELNLYIPLSYYVAYNPHFSHPAAGYSQRLQKVEAALGSASAAEFETVLATAKPSVNGLILYYDEATKTYPIFFWEDKWPNGGAERRLDLEPALIDINRWRLVSDADNWHIYLKN